MGFFLGVVITLVVVAVAVAVGVIFLLSSINR